MPNVVRGDRMGGLMSYLVGPGRANEHTEPHLVAGDVAMLAWHDDAELSRDGAFAIARHLDRPRTATGVEVALRNRSGKCPVAPAAQQCWWNGSAWQDTSSPLWSAAAFTSAAG